MLAHRLKHGASRIVAAILLAAVYACTSDSQQAEEIVQTQQKDPGNPANLEGEGNSSEVNVNFSSEESNANLFQESETAFENSAETSVFTPNSDEKTKKFDADGFVVDGTSDKPSQTVVDDKIKAEDTTDYVASAAAGVDSSKEIQPAKASGSATEVSSQNTQQRTSPSPSNETKMGASAASHSKKVLTGGSPSNVDSGKKTNSKSDVSKNGKFESAEKFTYTVKKGDTLSNISQEVYGRVGRWKKIAEHNKLVNPELIFPGQQLMIPKLSAKTDQTAMKTPVKNDQSLKSKSINAYGSGAAGVTGGKLGAIKKVEKVEKEKANSEKSEKSAATTADPAKLNAPGVIWEKPGDYSQVRPDGFATITVKPGFSITKIAEVMFGDAQQWKKVLEFNKLDTTTVNRLFVGQRINFKVPINSSQYPVAH